MKGLDKELNFIQKPFAIGVFAQKVRDVLDTKKGSKRKQLPKNNLFYQVFICANREMLPSPFHYFLITLFLTGIF